MSTSEHQSWICFQIGAREHYAIPRALKRCGALGAVVTDIWSPPRSFGRKLPGRLGELMKSRYHEELVNDMVIGFNHRTIVRETATRLSGNCGWTRIIDRNNWFQDKAVKAFKKLTEQGDLPTAVFAYSYAAKKVFTAARSLGIKTILGQIDPGPKEIELVNDIEKAHGVPLTKGPPPNYWKSWRQEVELADVVVANSRWSRNLLVESGIEERKVEIVPLVYEGTGETNKNIENQVSLGNERLRVLFLGQVIARKGVIELIEAAKILANRPVQWTIVGDGDPRLIDGFKSIPNARLVGQIPRDQVKSWYQKHDVFILPTHSDGFAITQLEAMAYGLPVIASKSCGDIVEHMTTGILLDSVDSTSIVASVDTLLSDPELLGVFQENLATKEFYTLEQLGEKLISCCKLVSAAR